MEFIKTLRFLTEKDDLSKLPDDIIKKLQKSIRDGAEDLSTDWDNVLILVKKAFEIEGVQIPTPAERTAFSQFEELLSYAVKHLADARKGTDDSWRMSSTVFREFKESMERTVRVRIYELGEKNGTSHTVQAKNMQAVIDMIGVQAGKKHFDMKVEHHDAGSCTCKFTYMNVERQYRVKLQLL